MALVSKTGFFWLFLKNHQNWFKNPPHLISFVVQACQNYETSAKLSVFKEKINLTCQLLKHLDHFKVDVVCFLLITTWRLKVVDVQQHLRSKFTNFLLF